MKTLLKKRFKPTITISKALHQVLGLSVTSIRAICAAFGISEYLTLNALTDRELMHISFYISKYYTIEDRLRRILISSVTAVFRSRTRRGFRMRRGLPVNGQRTHSNASTAARLSGMWVSSRIKAKRKKLLIKKQYTKKKRPHKK